MARLIMALVVALGVALTLGNIPWRKRERVVHQWPERVQYFIFGLILILASGSFLLYSYKVI